MYPLASSLGVLFVGIRVHATHSAGGESRMKMVKGLHLGWFKIQMILQLAAQLSLRQIRA